MEKLINTKEDLSNFIKLLHIGDSFYSKSAYEENIWIGQPLYFVKYNITTLHCPEVGFTKIKSWVENCFESLKGDTLIVANNLDKYCNLKK